MPGGGAGGGARLTQADPQQDRLEGEAAQYCPERYVLVHCVIDSLLCVRHSTASDLNGGHIIVCEVLK